MTFLGPMIMALLMVVPLWLTMDKKAEKTLIFSYIQPKLVQDLDSIIGVRYIFNNQINASSDSILSFFNADAEVRLDDQKFIYTSRKIDTKTEQTVLALLENKILKMSINNAPVMPVVRKYLPNKDDGRSVQELMAYAMGIGVYFFIFMYGVQIMKGVVEEKTNRIVEVMLCTVKPFELMMGKIAGISAVGFMQFAIWIFLVLSMETLISSQLNLEVASTIDLNQVSQSANLELVQDAQSYLMAISQMNFWLVLGGYIWFFLFGFLLYAAYFAVIGSASDVDTDTQQFILPITIPILGTIILAQNIVAQPHGTLATWLSWIPLTSPIAMPIRLPFESDLDSFGLEVLGSGLVLGLFFIFFVWIASRIYRIGILTYGSKVGYKQLVKWFFEKD
jgi:ABC-2 type transport system permease protein